LLKGCRQNRIQKNYKAIPYHQDNPTPPQNKDISLSITAVKDRTGLILNLLDVDNLRNETESSKTVLGKDISEQEPSLD